MSDPHVATAERHRHREELPSPDPPLGKTQVLTGDRMNRVDVFRMIRPRAKDSSLSTEVCHSFRLTGFTAYLENGGTLEHAQQIASHGSPRTTKLYDRTDNQIMLDEIERIETVRVAASSCLNCGAQ